MTVGYVLAVILALIAIGFAAPLIENKNYAAPDLYFESKVCTCHYDESIKPAVNWSAVFNPGCRVRWYVWCLV